MTLEDIRKGLDPNSDIGTREAFYVAFNLLRTEALNAKRRAEAQLALIKEMEEEIILPRRQEAQRLRNVYDETRRAFQDCLLTMHALYGTTEIDGVTLVLGQPGKTVLPDEKSPAYRQLAAKLYEIEPMLVKLTIKKAELKQWAEAHDVPEGVEFEPVDYVKLGEDT